MTSFNVLRWAETATQAVSIYKNGLWTNTVEPAIWDFLTNKATNHLIAEIAIPASKLGVLSGVVLSGTGVFAQIGMPLLGFSLCANLLLSIPHFFSELQQNAGIKSFEELRKLPQRDKNTVFVKLFQEAIRELLILGVFVSAGGLVGALLFFPWISASLALGFGFYLGLVAVSKGDFRQKLLMPTEMLFSPFSLKSLRSIKERNLRPCLKNGESNIVKHKTPTKHKKHVSFASHKKKISKNFDSIDFSSWR